MQKCEYYGLTPGPRPSWKTRGNSSVSRVSVVRANARLRFSAPRPFHLNASPEAMDEQSTAVEFTANPAKDIQITMRRMDRREWWLWSYAFMVTMLLLVGLASFAFPPSLSQADTFYSFFLNQAVRGLVGLVLIFNVYVIYPQVQITPIP